MDYDFYCNSKLLLLSFFIKHLLSLIFKAVIIVWISNKINQRSQIPIYLVNFIYNNVLGY